ncbi:hypothetical protein ATSB10_18590 [Dyella thiooxydans]|uniref:NIPSNAP domain-containing protein n=1 Tax=Dyella thiooxydans TaxID=445710 RepID=A0A160N0K6_9GAMM|nr:hypothetical protein [Dyella thiooxydans]AND69313.1 hypothetical protein ATSB10_18590 [Dyella thiooxydans]
MKRITAWLALVAGLFCVLGVQAADDSSPRVIRGYTDWVAPAEQQAYESGIKAYNQCLGEHGFKYAWMALNHETGDVYTYSYVSDPLSWADFDAMRDSGKACDASFRQNVNPHLKRETSGFMKVMPEMSYMPPGSDMGQGYIDVVLFTLKPGHEANEGFMTAVKKVTAAAHKAKWPNAYQIMQTVDSGEDAPDYILVSPSKDWADFGAEPNPTFWKMVANVYGDAQAKSLRKALNDAIKHVSAHVDRHNAELTYRPSGK